MHKVNGYTLTSNSHSTRQLSSLTIKRDGVVYARMRFKEPICDPLRQIQINPSNPYRAQLVESDKDVAKEFVYSMYMQEVANENY